MKSLNKAKRDTSSAAIAKAKSNLLFLRIFVSFLWNMRNAPEHAVPHIYPHINKVFWL